MTNWRHLNFKVCAKLLFVKSKSNDAENLIGLCLRSLYFEVNVSFLYYLQSIVCHIQRIKWVLILLRIWRLIRLMLIKCFETKEWILITKSKKSFIKHSRTELFTLTLIYFKIFLSFSVFNRICFFFLFCGFQSGTT